MKIPLVDLKAQHDSIRSEIDSAIKGVINSSAFIMGKPVKQFEENWAKFCNAKHCVGCANGTVAVEIALKALGVEKGDEVITVPNTFVPQVSRPELCIIYFTLPVIPGGTTTHILCLT